MSGIAAVLCSATTLGTLILVLVFMACGVMKVGTSNKSGLWFLLK
jgi:hypothetical protein